jgi:GT2 family glycosyltransferase
MDGTLGQQKSCSIIIVTYNSKSSIEACLTPVLEMPDVEIVVVDNDSTDGTATLLKERFPSVTLIALQDNIGFGRACNIGVSASSGSFILLLNPDAVASAQAIRTLIEFCGKHPRVGIVGGCLVDPSGLPLQSMGDRPTVVRLVLEKPIEWIATRANPCGVLRRTIGKYCAKLCLPHVPERVDWVSGAALCCRRQTWNDIGGFDENFFLYYEDVDLCLRAAQVGWEVWHVPTTVVSHQSGASFAGNVNYQKRTYYASQRYFFQKHHGSVVASLLLLAQKLYCWRRPWGHPLL